jgi:hypothetical protein
MKTRITPTIWLAAVLVCALGSPAPAANGVPRPDHVVIVIEENHGYSEIIGSSAAPYINSLAAQGALFTQSYAITHPSQPNYLDIFSGSNQGVTNDSCPHSFTTANLGLYLINASLTFGGYSEDLPSVGSTVCTSGAYARKHAPWVNFTNIPTTTNLPYSNFPTDYTTLPTVSFVIPNLNNDMHDGTIQQGDNWLQQHLAAYVQWAMTHNSLFIMTFDEDDSSQSNRIATIFVGPMVVSGQYSELINHFNLLRTLEDMYGLPYAGVSGNYQPITDVWIATTPTPTATPSATATPTATPSPSPTPTPTSTPACDCTPPPGYPSLGCAAPFTVFAINNPNATQKATFSGATVTGDVAASSGVTLALNSASTVNGNVYLAPGVTFTNQGHVNGTVFTNQSQLAQCRQDAINASAQAAALLPNFTYAKISTNTTINGVSGLNVVKVSSDISLGGSTNNLTLSGPQDAFFVVNVGKKLSLSGNAAVRTAGGMPSNHLLINMTGSGNNLLAVGSRNSVQGTLLGPRVGGNFHGVFGSLILGQNFNMSGVIAQFGGCVCP